MTEIVWLTVELVIAFHDEQLRIFGGPAGIRDEGMLESALGRPMNKYAYEAVDMADLAAAYAFGIARNHPFVDGNKRTSLVVAELFLALNRQGLDATDVECVIVWQKLAAGELDEQGLAQWFTQHLAQT